jgi:LuxR family transcriptional regulator, maltose regulon positive regulatory protein
MSGKRGATSRDPLARAWDAMADADWDTARALFDAALARRETAEALEGRSWVAWWLEEVAELFRTRERAYHLYRQQDDVAGAARMATWLGSDYLDFRAEPAIARGWLERARRLLRGREETSEYGWLLLTDAAYTLDVDNDTAAALRLAAQAADLGQRIDDTDVQMLGLAIEGLALVNLARVSEGMKRLDESSAAIIAREYRELHAVAWAMCCLIYACERVRDYDRAAQWCQRMKELAEGANLGMTAGFCRAHYGAILVVQGTWDEAEEQLTSARDRLIGSRPIMAGDALVRLAELRRRQGRIDEATELLAQAGEHPDAPLCAAELALDRGDAREAAECADRFLRGVPTESGVQRAAGLELVVRSREALGDVDSASAALRAVEDASTAVATTPARAAARFCSGVVAQAAGDHETARQWFEDAVSLYLRARAPFEAARARLELAQALAALDRRDGAETQLRSAAAAFGEIGAVREAERARSLMEALAGAGSGGAGATAGGLTARELEVLREVANGRSDREIAESLVLSEHTVHRHISNVLRKLGVSTRAAAVAHAARNGLL